MNLKVISPTYYPNTDQVKYLLRSAMNNGIDLHAYGSGKQYTDWIQTHITDCLIELKSIARSATHVLFTDASDVIFLKGDRDIVRRYNMLGHPPMLVSREPDGMNAGGWMGEVDVAIAILSHLATLAGITDGGNPQARWRHALRNRSIDVAWDCSNNIFSVNQWPTDACLIHFAGGYSDPATGRAHRIEPVWKELGWASIESTTATP
jgi:hypothetical protein